jgi:hypothetical protein
MACAKTNVPSKKIIWMCNNCNVMAARYLLSRASVQNVSRSSVPGIIDGNLQTRKESGDTLSIVVTTYIADYWLITTHWLS